MPELPEVETTVRALKNSFFINSVITGVEILKEKVFSGVSSEEIISKLKGQIITDVIRKGKWIFIHLTNFVLICHLKLTGGFFFVQVKTPSIVFLLGTRKIFFCDYRGFGKMYLQTFKDYKSSKPYIDIGVDAISDEFTENYLFSRISQIRSNLCIKVFLLDQKQVGGIGNIYVSEILFAVGIHPLSLVKKITSNDVQKIVFHTKRILADSIDCGGTSIIDWVSPYNKKGSYQERLKVYGRRGQSCYSCSFPISSFEVQKRITFACENCQPPLFVESIKNE